MIVEMKGKELSQKIIEQTKKDINDICIKYNIIRQPSILVISIGYDDASNIYIRNKEKQCRNCGIIFYHQSFNEKVSRAEMIRYIQLANISKTFDAILIQQPLSEHLKGIEQYIDPNKDVDGFTKYNLGALLYNKEYNDNSLVACTPLGILELLNEYNIKLQGKHIVIVGRSAIVGKPLIGLLLQKNATVTSCNSYTEHLKDITKTADILISAIGKAEIINKDYIGENCKVIIDVGMNRNKEGKLCGDVDYEDIKQSHFNTYYSTYITPVPGGVGPMTVAMLIRNIYKIFRYNIEKGLYKYE